MCELSDSLRKEAAVVLNDAVRETFRTLFGVDLRSEARSDPDPSNGLTCLVVFRQETVRAALSFTFERKLIASMVESLYPPDLLAGPGVFEDASCEIANIVCGFMKEFLNRRGFHLSMDIPYTIDRDERTPVSDRPFVHLHFSHDEKDLTVNFDLGDGSRAIA